MPVPPRARLQSVPEVGRRPRDDETGQYRHLAAFGVIGTASAIERE
jgi:hypothetical protein